MEQSQKLTFRSKNSQNVASPPDQDFPDTVLLFEPRISHPALRVTLTKKYLKLSQPRATCWGLYFSTLQRGWFHPKEERRTSRSPGFAELPDFRGTERNKAWPEHRKLELGRVHTGVAKRQAWRTEGNQEKTRRRSSSFCKKGQRSNCGTAWTLTDSRAFLAPCAHDSGTASLVCLVPTA